MNHNRGVGFSSEPRATLARALSAEDVNQLGRMTGQAERVRTVTPHRLFLAIVSALAGTQRENSSRWSPVHCASVPVPV